MTKRLMIALVALALFVLVAIVPVSATKMSTGPNYYYAVAQDVAAGSTVFIGEAHLNLQTAGITDGTVVGYWTPAADRTTSPPSKTVLITSSADYTVMAHDYGIGGSIADWYFTTAPYALAFRIADPTLDVNIWDPRIAADVSGQSVVTGENLQFGIVTNQYAALSTGRSPVYSSSTGDGYIDLKVKTESGAILSQLYTDMFASSANAVRLTSINVSTMPYLWGLAPLDAAAGGSAGVPPFSWHTGASISGQPVYAPGTYIIWAESLLNNMKSNYLDGSGAAYTGKTVSQVKTITLAPETVSITVNNNTVVRTHPFSVTINGNPSTYYNLWIKNTSGMSMSLGNAPPIITPYQAGVFDGNVITSNYKYQNGGGNTVGMDAYALPGTVYSYANVSTSTSGSRTIQFETTNFTKEQMYTIRVERNLNDNNYTAGDFRGAEVSVNVGTNVVNTVNATKIGIYNGGNWYIDFNGDGLFTSVTGDKYIPYGATGWTQVVGDWNGNGKSEIGIYKDGVWYLDYGGSGKIDANTRYCSFGGAGWTPVVGDWNSDGKYEIGVYNAGNWYLDYDGNGLWGAGDKNYGFGTTGWTPVIGNW